jgi:hypothetical protein
VYLSFLNSVKAVRNIEQRSRYFFDEPRLALRRKVLATAKLFDGCPQAFRGRPAVYGVDLASVKNRGCLASTTTAADDN